LEAALADTKRRQRFGLVYEEHIPEMSALVGLPAQAGSLVQRRDDTSSGTLYRVIEVSPGGDATVEPIDGGEPAKAPVGDLLVVKRFGEPIYPALTPLGSVRRGDVAKPHHAVINGENFHALQLLVYQFEGQVDCIYLDPPYNTGARDWKYNNRYVDDADVWRHSKWLSMMEKRLRLAKRLLKPDGVLIVTIDEHEVHHLGMLLEKLFPEYLRYLLTIVISARGNYKTNFARVEEYAFFCCPQVGHDVITGTRTDLLPEHDDIDVDPDAEEDPDTEAAPEQEDLLLLEHDGSTAELRHARRRGPDSRRRDRPSMFYPIFINEQARTIVRVGEAIPLEDEPDFASVDGLRPIWPVDAEGEHRRWRWGRERMQAAVEKGDVRLGRYNKKLDSWTINVVIYREDYFKKIKTVWRHTSHDAGTHGTSLVDKVLGQRGLFTFPKSVYAVRDCLAAVVRDRPNALIVDCFAGSGTTLHATSLLNAEDDGNRRCILVTNNEVEEGKARRLNKDGYYQGDPEFDQHGIFEQVACPRCESVVTGLRPDGTPIPGKHFGGRPFAEGFPENVEFYQLNYLDPDEVDLGLQFEAVLPTLWMSAGGIGEREKPEDGQAFSMPEGSTYGVLFDESRFPSFREALEERPEVTHAWLVTDSEEAYAEMGSALPRRLEVSMLYRDYLRNFKINTGRNL
jgi:adenine-specific DNA-methyltransferase